MYNLLDYFYGNSSYKDKFGPTGGLMKKINLILLSRLRLNTFLPVQNILEAIQLKHKNQGLNSQIPEFLVLYNDNYSTSDFNTLFTSLPPNRQYHAGGIPGSFYSSLFPSASLHIVYSSCSSHRLSAVSKEVVDRSSPAWDKERIYYSNAAMSLLRLTQLSMKKQELKRL